MIISSKECKFHSSDICDVEIRGYKEQYMPAIKHGFRDERYWIDSLAIW